MGAVDAPARTEGHYRVLPMAPGARPEYVAPNLAGRPYSRPQYVAPNLAGYGGAGGLGGDVQMSTLKLAKVVAKLEQRQAITPAERDFVLSAKPISASSSVPASATVRSLRDLGNLFRMSGILAFWGTNVDFVANVVDAVETGREIDWGAFSANALKDAENVLAALSMLTPVFAATVVLLPVAAVTGTVAPALGTVIHLARTGQAPSAADMNKVAGALAVVDHDEARRASAALKDPLVQGAVANAAKNTPAVKNGPRMKSAAVPSVSSTEKYNAMLARAKSLLSTTSRKAGPAPFKPRAPARGAQAQGAARAQGGSSSLLTVLVLGGAAVVAVSVLGKRKKRG